jgi:hypothetical protein
MKRNLYLTGLIFSFLLLFSSAVFAQAIQYERSYVNITKGAVGGTIEPGDELELRATLVVFTGTSISRCSFADVVPAGTNYKLSSLRVQTNEGVVVQTLTDAAGDDPGTRTGSNITIHVGSAATAVTGGNIVGATTTPKFYNATIIIAAYRVIVSAGYNSDITFQGTFSYRVGSGAVTPYNFTSITLRTYTNLAACADSKGSSAVIDNNGTFGSGTIQNRGASPAIPAGYTYQALAANQPNDGFYSIINNTSPTGATNPLLPKPGPARVFTVFDILGDHTGAAIPAAGNPPAAPGTNGGYMVLINASYRTDAAINQTVNNLCPNTYYDFSAWFRNICSLCGADANGTSTNTPGVKPNLSFAINGKAYYSSGEIVYNNAWIRKGFVYKTGPAETSLTITIRNNAPGGGGNDWVMDDVSFSICLPRVQFTAFPYYIVCQYNQVDISATVRSYYNNYTEYLWEKSTDNGASWVSAGVSGTGTPVLVAGQYEYTVNYPSFIGVPADSGTRYRIRIATTVGNLANANCSYVDAAQVSILQVKDCGAILPVTLLNFAVSNTDGQHLVQWVCANETGPVSYEVERSSNGIAFVKIGGLPGNSGGSGYNNYQLFFNDVNNNTSYYYRLKIISPGVNASYSSIVFIKGFNSRFDIVSLDNPFTQVFRVSLTVPSTGIAQVVITDINGVIRKKEMPLLTQGINNLTLMGMGELPPGSYLLQILFNNEIKHKKIVKYTQ